MIDYSGFLENRTSNHTELSRQNFLINGLCTEHKHGNGHAISHALLEHAGFDPETTKKWMVDNGWGIFEKPYRAAKFKKGYGYSQRFIPSKKAKKLLSKAMRWLRKQLEIRMVKNTRKGLVDITESEVVLTQETPVNLEEIKKFVRETTNEHHRHAGKAILARTSEEGIYLHQYIKGRTGRYQAIGYSLQNAPRALKEAAFKGIGYSYDIEGSQFNLLDQIFEGTIPSIRNFCENKKSIRLQVARELGCSLKESKRYLTASLFGISTSSKTEGGVEIGESNFIKQLDEELEQVAAFLKQETRTSGYSPTVDSSEIGSGLAPEIWKTLGWARKRLAYVLQNEEVKVLESLMEAFDDDIIFLHHDSITTTRRISSDELSRVVFEKTGYRLKFEETIH